MIKNSPAVQKMQVGSLGREDPLEEEMATHSSIFAWEIPWTVDCRAPLSTGILQQEYRSGLPRPPPGDLPYPGIQLRSPALQADSLPSKPPGNPPKGLL